MEDSIIFDLLYSKHIGEYREALEKDEDDNFAKWLIKSREILCKNLSKEKIKLLDKYKFDIDMREDYIDIQVGIKILNYGIKIGMELKQAFINIEED